ncbi:RmlC-like cupin domain-containing protein [Xylaria palmicola]|nr:RmlC-like cupin domain-containing protein [Xylaria palmicola]
MSSSSSSAPALTAEQVIETLNLAPHPEKGYYVETFRDSDMTTSGGQGAGEGQPQPRACSTCIYYLLEGEAGPSHWHRVRDAVEVWHHYAGAPLRLSLWRDGDGDDAAPRDIVLGTDLLAGQRPQVVVRRDEWQHAVSLGDWTLVGCSVAPAFTFDSFQMAEPGWEPNGGAAAGGEEKK